MTRNEESLQALFNSNESGWCFIFGTDKASVFEKDGRYMVEYSYGNQVSNPEYFDDKETAKEYAIDLSQSRKPIKSNAYTDGYDAYFNRLEKSDNPYFKVTDPIEYQEWDRGWKMAEDDYMAKLFDLQDDSMELYNSRRPIKSGWTFIFGTDKAAVYENDNVNTYKVECRNGSNFIDEYFDDEQDAREFAIEVSGE